MQKEVKIILTSATSGEGVDKILDHMHSFRNKQGKNFITAYAIGAVNVGKSSLLNQIIKHARKKEYIIKKRR